MDVPRFKQSHGRSRSTYGLALCQLCTWILAIFFGALIQTSAFAEEVTDPQALDAELTDVYFLTNERGWAVGDRGVIWHTRDAGRSWHLQSTHVACRLNSIFFLDEEHGWAAGGWTQPFTHVSQGVILRTRDGGRTWSADRNGVIPLMQRIKFFDMKTGFAIGRSSALYPSGVFTTEDGGATWSPLPAQYDRAWTTGDFLGLNTGALAGPAGAVATIRRRTLEKARNDDLGLRGLYRMELQGPTDGFLVGDGGLVLTTADLGQSWQTTTGSLPQGAAKHFDFHALAVRGENLWVAGSPGTRVFHSPDRGKTWSAQNTQSFVPIEGLHFVDARTGWAVGALGTILVTDDGGKTWQRQRGGGTRAAVLGMFSEPSKAPLELAAQLGGSDGYLTAYHFLVRRDLEQAAAASPDLSERAQAAVVEVGGTTATTAWQFPLRQDGLGFSAEQLLATLDLATDGRAGEILEEHVVEQIRTWRPEVIVTHHVSPRGDDPLGHLINQVVMRAVEQASDSTRHLELASEAGLEPWRVKKVYVVLAPGEKGAPNIDTMRLDPRLGRAVVDIVSGPRGLIANEHSAVSPEIPFRMLINNLPQDRGREDFFSGISLSPGGEARRMIQAGDFDSFQQLRRAAQLRRNIQQLITSAEENPARTDAWSGQLGDLTRGLEPNSACQVLYQLAGNYVQSGRWDIAAETFQALVDRHPHHSLAQAAQTWLVQYHASGEAAWRMQRRSKAYVQQTSAVAPAGGVVRASGDIAAGDILSREGNAVVGNRDQFLEERLQIALNLGKQLEQTQPALYAEPNLRFSLASAERRLGLGGQAERYYMNLRRTRTNDAWRAAAEGEEWLGKRNSESPKSNWRVGQTAERPHLDGQLNEAFWLNARPIVLSSSLHDDAEWPATAAMAYDSEFLYLGIKCRKVPGIKYADVPPGTRTHDADLKPHDRVELLLDIDRDFATYYRLCIDQRGWTSEACWGDVTWNPTWYVAPQRDDQGWTAEVAIPFAELTSQSPEAGKAWAAGLQRIVPGAGFQSWTQPAGTTILPEGFGYLIFE